MNLSDLFSPDQPLLEMVIRGSAIYWFLLIVFRFVLRRDIGSMSLADLLFIVLVADASSSAMQGEYKSITNGVVLLGTHHSRDITAPSMAFLAPAMYWYGWTATAALGALVFGLVAALLPERWTQRVWPDWQWVVPAFAMIACVYLTLPWFRL